MKIEGKREAPNRVYRLKQIAGVAAFILFLPIMGLVAKCIGKQFGTTAGVGKNAAGSSARPATIPSDIIQTLGGILALAAAMGLVFLAIWGLRARDRFKGKLNRKHKEKGRSQRGRSQ